MKEQIDYLIQEDQDKHYRDEYEEEEKAKEDDSDDDEQGL